MAADNNCKRNTISFDSIDHMSVAIRTFEANDKSFRWRHVGIFFRSPVDKKLKLLHLAWHFDLQCNEITDEHKPFVAVVPKIEETIKLKLLAVICQNIWDTFDKDKIAYGFSEPYSYFTEKESEILIGPNNIGLTCATFVLAVFNIVGLKPINIENWEPREDDIKWQGFIISQLENQKKSNKNVSDAHLKAIKTAATGIRFRPGETIAAIHHPDSESEQSDIEPIGTKIEQLSDKWFASLI